MTGGAVVLIVEPNRVVLDRVGRWVEGAGYEVLACPGPGAPTYACLGSRGTRRCPLAAAADLVVLDLWLAGDRGLQGTGSVDLLRYYRRGGAPILALAHGDGSSDRLVEDGVVVLDGPPDRREIVETVGAMVRRWVDVTQGGGRR
jgi:DNA-binding response OmpR family regulator